MKTRNRIIPLLAVVVFGGVACANDAASTKPAKATKTLAEKLPPSATPEMAKASKAVPEAKAVALTSTAPAKAPSLFDHALAPERELPARLTKKSEPGEIYDHPEEEAEGFREVTASEVKVQRFVLATDVSDREPLGESDVFAADTPKIFAFLQLENQAEPYQVSVHFESVDDPKLPYGIDLDVKTSPRYRTWAYTRVRREPGMYRAVVRTLDGEDIAIRDFEIIEAQETPVSPPAE